MDPIIIIGTGMAGYNTAKEFRKHNADQPLIMVTQDDGMCYSKPMLSTALTRDKTPETIPTSDAAGMAEQLGAKIITETSVSSIDSDSKKISLSNGDSYTYYKLVLATGGVANNLPLKGNAVDKVQSVNSLTDYREFYQSISGVKKVALVGAGLIGCEFANDLSNKGYDVHVIDPMNLPLCRILPQDIAGQLKDALSENGVTWHLGNSANSVDQSPNGYKITLSDDQVLEADVVLSAIGIHPDLSLAKAAGLKTERGIYVDDHLESSVKDIYAIGDCAEVMGHILPYTAPLLHCAKHLGAVLAGSDKSMVYPAMPVTVKTPVFPMLVCPAPQGVAGQWQIEDSGNAIHAQYIDENQAIRGFILAKDAIRERAHWVAKLPALI